MVAKSRRLSHSMVSWRLVVYFMPLILLDFFKWLIDKLFI